MNTPSERIPLVGLTLADGHAISDQLRARSLTLRALSCDARAMGEDNTSLEAEREHVLMLRDAVIQATTRTLNGLG